jgi:hypothetical protein
VGLTVEPRVLALVYERFLWQLPYMERSQGVLGGVRRGAVGPPGPPELAALRESSCTGASPRSAGRASYFFFRAAVSSCHPRAGRSD